MGKKKDGRQDKSKNLPSTESETTGPFIQLDSGSEGSPEKMLNLPLETVKTAAEINSVALEVTPKQT